MSQSTTDWGQPGAGWLEHLAPDLAVPALRAFIASERREHDVFPPDAQLLRALLLTPLDAVRVVILGQDPYHGAGQAHGLSFSVERGVPIPPSLRNIFKELQQDLGVPTPAHGDLTRWAEQGVLLLNTVLSVRAHSANSHRGQGWEQLTDTVIEVLNAKCQGLVFVLWGAAAGKKAKMIDPARHQILRAPHPSPLSAYRGFLGCRHFSKINAHLERTGLSPIDWRLD